MKYKEKGPEYSMSESISSNKEQSAIANMTSSREVSQGQTNSAYNRYKQSETLAGTVDAYTIGGNVTDIENVYKNVDDQASPDLDEGPNVPVDDDEDTFIGDQPSDSTKNESNAANTLQTKAQNIIGDFMNKESESSTIFAQGTSMMKRFINISTEEQANGVSLQDTSYHSDKIDYILNDIPDLFNEEMDKGFLSILNSNSEMSKEQIEALRVPLDSEGWDIFDRVFLGKKDVKKCTENIEKISLDPSTLPSVEESLGDNNEQNYSEDDPFGLLSVQKDLLALVEEKDDPVVVEHPEGAWWIDEMKSQGWLNEQNTKNLEELLNDEAFSGESSQNENKNTLNTLLADIEVINEKIQNKNDGDLQ